MRTMGAFFLLLILNFSGAFGVEFISLDPGVDTADIPACFDFDAVDCIAATVDFDALKTAEDISLPGGVTFSRQTLLTETDGAKSVAFVNDQGDEALFTIRNGNAFGHVEYPDGSVYLLENCGEGCHVWKLEDETEWEDEPEEENRMQVQRKINVIEGKEEAERRIKLEALGREDSSTIVTYSVMLYYTPELAATTPDVQTFMDQIIADTNEGYINSNIPVRIKIHCIQASDLHDMHSASKMLAAFENWKPLDELLNSADSAALIVNDFQSCGVGNFDAFNDRRTLTVSKKICNLGYYSFGHEMAHNFGATHDKLHGTNAAFSYGYGSHIGPKFLGGKGWRSIMAYSSDGYKRRANYYSNPKVKYLEYATGTADKEDNARVITQNRFKFAAIGDESSACSCGETLCTTIPVACIEKDVSYNGSIKKWIKNVGSYEICQKKCAEENECQYFKWYNEEYRSTAFRMSCFLLKTKTSKSNAEMTVSGRPNC